MPKDAGTEAEPEAVAVSVTQNVPEVRVKVAPGNTVGHGDQLYTEGEEFTMDGPTAIQWLQLGHIELA